jgi:hypothetical protein
MLISGSALGPFLESFRLLTCADLTLTMLALIRISLLHLHLHRCIVLERSVQLHRVFLTPSIAILTQNAPRFQRACSTDRRWRVTLMMVLQK